MLHFLEDLFSSEMFRNFVSEDCDNYIVIQSSISVTVTGIYSIKVNLKEIIKIEGNSVIFIIFHSIFESEIRSHLTCNS